MTLEHVELAGSDLVVDDTNNAMIFVRKLGQGPDVGVAAVVPRPVRYRLGQSDYLREYRSHRTSLAIGCVEFIERQVELFR